MRAPRGTVSGPVVGRDLADDEAEQRRLARAVAPDEADPGAGRQRDGRVVEQDAGADAIGEVVDVQHGGAFGTPARSTATPTPP